MAEALLSAPKRCESRRRDGGPCQAPALPGRPLCFAHDPEHAAERDAARRRGGRNTARSARLRGLVPPRLLSVYDVLEMALGEVHSGKLDARQASAMAALASAMVRVLTSGELEERVRKLEQTTG